MTPRRVATAPETGGTDAPWIHWRQAHEYINSAWDPEHNPHHSTIGLTGSGKTYLTVNGILRQMCAFDRVLLIDSKGDDKIVSQQGRPVDAITDRPWYIKRSEKPKPFDHWQRLVVPGNRHTERGKAQSVVARALDRVYNEGDWVLFIDEIVDIATAAPGLGLKPYLDEIYRMGRSRGISVVANSQMPAYAPRTFFDQCSFAWLGRIRDRERQKRLLEIGGLTTAELPFIADLKRQEWLLAADNGEKFFRTKVEI